MTSQDAGTAVSSVGSQCEDVIDWGLESSDGRLPTASIRRKPFAALLFVISLLLTFGGAWLTALGGSGYYVVAGLVGLSSAVQL